MKGAFAVIIRSESLCERLSIPMEKEKFASLRRSQELTFESAFSDKKVQHRKMLNLFLASGYEKDRFVFLIDGFVPMACFCVIFCCPSHGNQIDYYVALFRN